MGVDNGTQSTKVVIYDTETKEVIDQASAPHDLISDEMGTKEQKAEWWISALQSCCAALKPELKSSVTAVGVSGQQHGFVPLDADGNVLYNTKLWCDTATLSECAEITERFGGDKALLDEVGNIMLPGYTAPKILWLKNKRPELYEKLTTILLPHDYLNFYLTGERVMEYGDASGTGLLDIRNKTWNAKAIEALDPDRDISTCLPRLIEPHEPAGFVKEEIAQELGIPPGIIVSSGGGDNMMGAIGTGTTSNGKFTMSLGTSGTLYGYSDKPVIDTTLAAFCSSTGGWLPLLCTMNCTVATELSRSLFDVELPELEKQVSQSPIGSGGVITLPFFSGERSPNLPTGKGSIMGLTMDNYKRENVLRSSMESAILGMRFGLDAFAGLGFEAKEVRLIGGGSKSAAWCQMASDILNLPVALPLQQEAAAMGAAVQALWAYENKEQGYSDLDMLVQTHVLLDEENKYSPILENVQAYKEVYQTYSKYVEALRPLYS